MTFPYTTMKLKKIILCISLFSYFLKLSFITFLSNLFSRMSGIIEVIWVFNLEKEQFVTVSLLSAHNLSDFVAYNLQILFQIFFRFQRGRPIVIDPGLYLSKKFDLVTTTEKRELPTSFELYTGKYNISCKFAACVAQSLLAKTHTHVTHLSDMDPLYLFLYLPSNCFIYFLFF